MRPMRSMFHTKRHNVPSLNMASMPDLIFTVLFFFMIVTHMRSDEVKVQLNVPEGKEMRKLANGHQTVNIYIGKHDGEWAVQLNGELTDISAIPARIEALRASMPKDEAEHLTVSFRADKRAPMGLISDVKEQLKQSYALRINYSANEKVSGPGR